jgi:hypothetical protein
MTKMIHISVTLTRKTRLEQALKNAGIENPAAVTRLAVAGTFTESDFAYIRENMRETLHRLDMREASVRKNKIPDGAFNNCRELSAVIMPDTTTEIGDCIFNFGNRMRSFTIPASVVKINGAASFGDCKFRTITVHPDNPVYASEDGVLFNKDKTELLLYPAGRKGDYTVPASVVKIAGSAFHCCEMATLTIDCVEGCAVPETVKEIEDHAFNHCTVTSSLVFPASVTDISHHKFCDCYLTDIVVHPDNPVYSSDDGVLFNKDKTELIICPNRKWGDYVVPASVVKIADCAFDHCDLSSVAVPASVIEIGSEAFFYCTRLTSIEIPDTLVEIKERAFKYCRALTSVAIPASTVKIAEDAFDDCHYYMTITVHPDNPFYTSENGKIKRKRKTKTNNMTTIFVLKVNLISFELDENREEYLPVSYPFETQEIILGYFSLLHNAEYEMDNYIVLNNKRDYPQRIHSFIIMEYVLDDADNEHGFAPFETRRSYLSNGKLEELCLVSERGFDVERGRFWGRKPEEIRFRIGDIVELAVRGHQIVPCIVVGLPITVEERQKRSDEKFRITGIRYWFYGDYSDDFYLLIPYMYNGSTVTIDDMICPETSLYPLDIEANSFHVFPPTIPVPDDIKEALQSLYHAFNTERMERFLKMEEQKNLEEQLVPAKLDGLKYVMEQDEKLCAFLNTPVKDLPEYHQFLLRELFNEPEDNEPEYRTLYYLIETACEWNIIGTKTISLFSMTGNKITGFAGYIVGNFCDFRNLIQNIKIFPFDTEPTATASFLERKFDKLLDELVRKYEIV